jgi:hypothetical protein
MAWLQADLVSCLWVSGIRPRRFVSTNRDQYRLDSRSVLHIHRRAGNGRDRVSHPN